MVLEQHTALHSQPDTLSTSDILCLKYPAALLLPHPALGVPKPKAAFHGVSKKPCFLPLLVRLSQIFGALVSLQ